MAYTEAKKRANRKWDAENYERLNLMVPKGMNERIDKAVEASGSPSKRAFCIEAIEKAIEETKIFS